MFSPADLGLPDHFPFFRAVQEEAIEHTLTSDKRFVGLSLPMGAGKSIVAVALARILGGRTVILTSAIGLEEQYKNDFGPLLASIRGRGNYTCWEGGTCEDGGRLGCKDHLACPYKLAFKYQASSDIVLTNYAYWLALRGELGTQQPVETLICDEAGLADSWLSRSLDFWISEKDLHTLGYPLPATTGESISVWQAGSRAMLAAAQTNLVRIKAQQKDAKHASQREKYAKEIKKAESLLERCSASEQISEDNWVCTKIDDDEGRLWRFECVWPGMYRERLFRGVKRVILMSATLRPKTLGLLGIGRNECDFREWGRQFPAVNGPVIWIPTARVNHRMEAEDEQRWIDRHREIFDWGSDRNGIVHSVSYARAKQIANNVGRRNVILNGAADPDSQSATDAYRKFEQAERSVLISPSFSTGWDFAGKRSEWQVISKLPIPDGRSKIMKARSERDRGYAFYVAAQDFVQACGRIQRSYTDRGMTIIIDDSWTWFKGVAKEYMPRWFQVRREDRLPKPLEKI